MSTEMCSKCSLPEELCVCTDMKKSDSRTVTVTTVENKYNEETVIDGVKQEEREDVASEIKSAVAAGGTVKKKGGDDREKIYIHGDHTTGNRKDQIEDVLEAKDYEVIFS